MFSTFFSYFNPMSYFTTSQSQTIVPQTKTTEFQKELSQEYNQIRQMRYNRLQFSNVLRELIYVMKQRQKAQLQTILQTKPIHSKALYSSLYELEESELSTILQDNLFSYMSHSDIQTIISSPNFPLYFPQSTIQTKLITEKHIMNQSKKTKRRILYLSDELENPIIYKIMIQGHITCKSLPIRYKKNKKSKRLTKYYRQNCQTNPTCMIKVTLFSKEESTFLFTKKIPIREITKEPLACLVCPLSLQSNIPYHLSISCMIPSYHEATIHSFSLSYL